MSDPLVVRSRRMVLPRGEYAASFVAEHGVITSVGKHDAPAPAGARVLDAGARAVLPGLVDPHVHANEPGRTHWEGLDTATRAAAAGGVTTIVDMPLNSLPPTTTLAALEEKRGAARGRVWTDVAFWGGAVPGNVNEFQALHAAGVCGFKAFLADSGVPEFPALDAAGLRLAMTECARLGTTLIVHAELPEPLRPVEPGRRYRAYLDSRPQASEVAAIGLIVHTARTLADRELVPRVHVVHLSASDALPVVAEARAEGLALTAETCPHYLALVAEEIADGATLCKCAPPIRERANREGLWQGLGAGTITLLASDHSPSPPDGKALDSGDFASAWGGISSLGLGLSVVWTEASRRGFALTDIARWMSSAPAGLVSLAGTKGALAVGRDADFCVFDPEAEWTVDPAHLWTRHRITPYAGWTVRGRVRETWLAGEPVYADDRFAGVPSGRLLAAGRGVHDMGQAGAR